LPFASAAGKPHNDLRRQGMCRIGLVIHDSPSTMRFVATDNVLSAHLPASSALSPWLAVERADPCEVD